MWLETYLKHQKSKQVYVTQEGKATAQLGLNPAVFPSHVSKSPQKYRVIHQSDCFSFSREMMQGTKMFLPFPNYRSKNRCLGASWLVKFCKLLLQARLGKRLQASATCTYFNYNLDTQQDKGNTHFKIKCAIKEQPPACCRGAVKITK